MAHEQLRGTRWPRNIEELWDQAVLGLNNDLIAINVNAFSEALGLTPTEVSNDSVVKDLPLSPVEHFMTSTDAGDTHMMLLTLLDGDRRYEQRFVQLNGTTPVSLGTIYRALLIENASGITIGGSQFPSVTTLGIVTVYETGGTGAKGQSDTFLTLEKNYAGQALLVAERSFDSASTIPQGFTGYAFGFNAISGASDDVTLSIQARIEGGVFQTIIPEKYFESTSIRRIRPRRIPMLTDLRVLAMKAGGTVVTLAFSYQLLFIKNEPET